MKTTSQLNKVIVRLNISKKQILSYYRGKAQWVVCNSIDGRSVKFPARILQLVVENDGVKGLYQLCFKADGSFSDISKIKD